MDSDVDRVLRASAVLDIAEVDLFSRAYLRWYGRAASAEDLERLFVAYMFADRVPIFVRDYARRVLNAETDRREMPAELHPPAPSGRRTGFGIAMLLLQLVILLGLVGLAEFSLSGSGPFPACILPPCY